MAVTVTANLSLVNACNSATDWVGSSLGTDTETYLEGTASITLTSRNGLNYAVYTRSAGALDLSATDTHLYFWSYCSVYSHLLTKSNGGMRLRLEDTSSNYYEWYMAGSDTWLGEWKCFTQDINATPDASSGTLSYANIDTFHFGFYNPDLTRNVDNCWVDVVRYGTGLTVTGGTSGAPGTFSEVLTADESSSYGIIRELQPDVYGVQGQLTFGDSSGATSTYFDDEDSIVIFEENPVSDDLYQLNVVGNATGTNSFVLGNKVGTGDTAVGANGLIFQSAGPPVSFDFSGSNVNTCNIYGTLFRSISDGLTLSDSSSHEFIGNTVDRCGQVDANQMKIRTSTFSATTHTRTTAQNVFLSDDGGSFTNQTTASNNATTGDMTLMPSPTTLNDATYWGWLHQFDTITLTVSTAGVGTYAITWEYWDGSSWTTLTTTDGTSSFKTAGTNDIAITLPDPNDWATTSINGLGPFYYVRARNSSAGTMTTAPLGTQSWLYGPTDGTALLWHSSIDIKNSFFNANTDDTNNPHAIEHEAIGTFTYDNLQFTSNDYDVENSITATNTATYSETNQSATQALGNGTIVGTSQSFTGDGNDLANVQFFLSKTGAPTGNATAYIYTHSGTFGTSSVPTGTALATSETFDVSTLTTGLNLIDIFFTGSDNITLTNTTNYVVALEYSGGDGGNYVNIGTDTSSPTHGGNFATLTGTTWSAVGGTDAIFKVRTGGKITINATNGTNVGTIDYTGLPPGTSTINNSVDLVVDGVVQNTQCYMVTGTGTELLNAAATTLVSGNEYKATTTHNYTADLDVTVRAREMGYLPFETTGTIDTNGLTTTAVWLIDPNWKLEVSGENIQFTNATSLITRTGNFTTDGWLVVMGQVTVEGSTNNDGTYTITAVGTTTITVSGTLTDEGPASGVTLTYTRREPTW